ncbi:hypothetical protein STSO111631_20240 [Stackebrandtia soli]
MRRVLKLAMIPSAVLMWAAYVGWYVYGQI